MASADFKMIDLGKYSKSYGFLGFAFNMIDTKNYDIAYVRLVSYHIRLITVLPWGGPLIIICA